MRDGEFFYGFPTLRCCWTKAGSIGVGNVIPREDGAWVGIKDGKTFSAEDHYVSEALRAKIVAVDEENETGMWHDTQAGKVAFVGCFVHVRKAHYCGGRAVYYCHELEEYFSDSEIEILAAARIDSGEQSA